MEGRTVNVWGEGEMRGRRRILGLAALLSFLLAVPLVFSLGIIEFPNFSSESLLSTASVFVDPDKVIKDYVLDPGYQIGDTFTVHVNVTDVTDLYTWHVNMEWNKDILNVSNIVSGDFLATSPNQTSSEALGWVVNKTDNAEGYSGFAETILGDITGISGNGRLVSIEFLIVGYGCTNLNISVSGTLPTTLLDSAGDTITFDTADGYFRNKLVGDANAIPPVNILDILKVKYHWYPGPPMGTGGYDRNVDINDDGSVNILDILLVKANWGRTT